MKKGIIIVVVLLLLGLVVFASLRGGGGEQGEEVDVEEIAVREIRRVVKASGVVDPRVKVNISSHVIAKIEHLYVEEGDEVEAGQAVLELERENFLAARDDWRARLAQARTAVRQAEVELADRQVRQRRAEQLFEQGITSQEQRDTAQLATSAAQAALEQARESISQAQANLTKAEDDLRKTTIYAPLSGRVIDLNAEQGEVVVSGTMNNPASVIATLADLSELLAEVDVDETEIVYVAVGQEAELVVDALPDDRFAGRVVEVGSSGFSRPDQPDVTFFKVKVLFAEPGAGLKPAMSVRAEIVTAVHDETLAVPIQSVVQRPPVDDEDDDEIQVVFVAEDGVATQRPVQTGISDATHVEVTSGVAAGDKVVSGPYRTLRDLDDGDAVRVDDEQRAEAEPEADDGDDGDEAEAEDGDDEASDEE